jgi:nucleoside-specific outer membrane channel protein Tsx
MHDMFSSKASLTAPLRTTLKRSALRATVIGSVCAAALAPGVRAADWSDTALSLRYGTTFAEPFDNNADGSRKDIKKAVLALTNATGYKYGTTFINVDFLMSDHNDPGAGVAGNAGAQEVYAVFRHTLDIGKVSGKELKFGPVRGLGLTAGFDWNTKNDGYASKKRMLVVGPTAMFDVPGFLNVSALLFSESNAPNGVSRYHYKNHGALEADWGIAIGSLPLTFNGYALYIGSKGQNEFGGATAPETHVDMSLMLDAGALAGGPKKTFLVGLEYEYWRNKFGNPTTTPGAGEGATARTPMIRAEYHF